MVARLRADLPWAQCQIWPGLAKILIGTMLGLDKADGEIHYPLDVPALDIEAIWQPGMDEYDRHTELWRT